MLVTIVLCNITSELDVSSPTTCLILEEVQLGKGLIFWKIKTSFSILNKIHYSGFSFNWVCPEKGRQFFRVNII